MGAKGLSVGCWLLVVGLVAVAGCTSSPARTGAVAPASSTTVAQATLPPVPVASKPHWVRSYEHFVAKDVIAVGTRGYKWVCGALTEQGLSTQDSKTHAWTLPPRDLNGTPMEIHEIVFNFTMGPTAVEGEVALFNAAGKQLGYGGYAAGLADSTQITLPGPFAPGDYKVMLRSCVGVNGEFDVDGYGLYLADTNAAKS